MWIIQPQRKNIKKRRCFNKEKRTRYTFHSISYTKMAFSSSLVPHLTTIILLLAINSGEAVGCYQSIISFGDSLADTGNFFHSSKGKPNHSPRLPFGRTHFRRSTGRFSDGRLMIDFIAEAVGLPFVPPFLGGADDGDGFRYGVNFAVGGATALDNDFFREKGFDVGWTNHSLSVQLGWFKQLLPSLCASDSGCKDILSRSLFLAGEIGGNDYNHGFLQGRSFDEIQTFVPRIIDTIGSAITELIALGARTLVVPGNFPIGCTPAYLTLYQSNLDDDYDQNTGCIKWLNEFAEYHNLKLLEELDRIRSRHTSATIIYADYYNAAMRVFRDPKSFGFGQAPLEACCGAGGPYNYNSSVLCESETAKVCDDPSAYISWDGLHLTEAAYRAIADDLLNGPFTTPAINHKCPQVEEGGGDKRHIEL